MPKLNKDLHAGRRLLLEVNGHRTEGEIYEWSPNGKWVNVTGTWADPEQVNVLDVWPVPEPIKPVKFADSLERLDAKLQAERTAADNAEKLRLALEQRDALEATLMARDAREAEKAKELDRAKDAALLETLPASPFGAPPEPTETAAIDKGGDKGPETTA